NLTLELLIRVGSLFLLLAVGLAVSGSVIAMLAGVTGAYAIGMWSLRGLLGVERDEVRLRAMLSFGLTAAAGTLGIILLYNLDVVLAAHYLDKQSAGIYGSLNKIEVIIYYGTLSVSQVLFPRVVEAIASRRHPGRLLLLSGGLMTVLGIGAIAIFGVTRGLVAALRAAAAPPPARGRQPGRRRLAYWAAGTAPGQNKNPAGLATCGVEVLGNDLLSHCVTAAVPSALEGLNSVFGMGTVVSPPP